MRLGDRDIAKTLTSGLVCMREWSALATFGDLSQFVLRQRVGRFELLLSMPKTYTVSSVSSCLPVSGLYALHASGVAFGRGIL
jgi:hypothetical protein